MPRHRTPYDSLLRSGRTLAVCFVTLTALVGCDQAPVSEAATPATPSTVASIIDSLETSNDSTKRLLDDARVQLDTALQGMVEISALLDRLAGQRIRVEARTPANAGAERASRESINTLRRRSVAQLETLRRRLADLTTSLSGVRDTSRTLNEEVTRLSTIVGSMTERLKSQEARLEELTAVVARVSAERDSAVRQNVALVEQADTLQRALDSTIARTYARDDSVFVLISESARLRSIGVAEWTGGVLGLGRVLRLRTDFPKGVFTVASKHNTTTFAMPQADRKYRILSGQRQSCYSWSTDATPVLRIHDPECFWETSRYLVIEERK